MRLVQGSEQPEAYVTREEMARRLGISTSLLDKMRTAGEIPSVTWGRRTRRYLPSLVIRTLSQREVASRSPQSSAPAGALEQGEAA